MSYAQDLTKGNGKEVWCSGGVVMMTIKHHAVGGNGSNIHRVLDCVPGSEPNPLQALFNCILITSL